MATDIIAITGHTLTISDIIDLPKQIDNWMELKELYLSDYKNKSEHNYSRSDLLKNIVRQSFFNREMNETTISDIWKNNEELSDKFACFIDICLDTFFGRLYINRHTIQIKLFPEHKYANLFYHNHCEYILAFNRVIAKKLGQSKIIYTADNGHGFYEIENMANEGRTFECIIDFGQSKFGITSTSITENIKNMFFIDDMSNNIEYFEELSWKDIENQK